MAGACHKTYKQINVLYKKIYYKNTDKITETMYTVQNISANAS